MRKTTRMTRVVLGQAVAVFAVIAAAGVTLAAQSGPPKPTPPAAATAASPSAAANKAAPDSGAYVIGPDDVLSVVFWKEKDVSGDATVRPDGKITLPLIGDIQAAGLTPEALVESVTTAAKKFFDDPSVSIVVKTINSRKVFINGAVGHPGAYVLGEHMTVVQLIAIAGGLQEFADKKHITIVHTDKRPDGVPWSHTFSYEDFENRKNLSTNIELKPGDTVIVK
jgi:polysaccharide export outer membrane protein